MVRSTSGSEPARRTTNRRQPCACQVRTRAAQQRAGLVQQEVCYLPVLQSRMIDREVIRRLPTSPHKAGTTTPKSRATHDELMPGLTRRWRRLDYGGRRRVWWRLVGEAAHGCPMVNVRQREEQRDLPTVQAVTLLQGLLEPSTTQVLDPFVERKVASRIRGMPCSEYWIASRSSTTIAW
jgi:hypothetical protein